MKQELIPIEARVVEYVRGALVDDFQEGGFGASDGTLLKLDAPPEAAGRERMVYHNQAPPEDSFWRREGARIRAKMDKRDFDDDSRLVFTDGLYDVGEMR
ncbi:MAG: hypothetical protein SFV54_18175 [Bryobacteraceae bacterium]|nr:hypothetical protein [Bryobacteraceae bacterium]